MNRPIEILGTGVFAETIRPLFREKDRNAMLASFDLWSYPDVVSHQDAILRAVSSGAMPCDARWTVTAFARLSDWIAAGAPE